MAEWRGMKVKLDSPSRIQKGEPGYGRKKFKVFVMSGGKRYSGTLIRETKTHKFARTENGKIKKIKK